MPTNYKPILIVFQISRFYPSAIRLNPRAFQPILNVLFALAFVNILHMASRKHENNSLLHRVRYVALKQLRTNMLLLIELQYEYCCEFNVMEMTK